MSTATKLSNEILRMLRERLTWIVIALSAIGAIWFSLNGTGRTASDGFIINAAKNSAFLGAFLFSLLSLAQMHRDYKNKTDVIVLTSTDAIYHQARRTLALIGVAIITVLLISLFALPFGLFKTGEYFQFATFIAAWFLIYLGALVFSVLLSSGLYMLTKRLEVALVLMVGLILLSNMLGAMSMLNPSYLLYWVQTTADSFSDLITNQLQIRMLFWNRLFCLLMSLAVWAFGLCSLRRFERGLLGSILSNFRRIWIPALLVAALSMSAASYAFEPLFDDSKPTDFSGMISSGTGISTYISDMPKAGNSRLTLTDKRFNLDVDVKRGSLSGVAKYKVENTTGSQQTLPVQINTGLSIDRVIINGTEGKALRGETGEGSTANWSIQLPSAGKYEIELAYSGCIRNDNTIIQKVTYGISDGYVSLPPLGVSPRLDINVAKDNVLSCTLVLEDNLEPILLNGKAKRGADKEGKTMWQYDGTMGTQGISFFAAEYQTKTFEAGGLNIDFKYFKKHEKSVTNMDAAGVIKAAIDYFTQAYGPLVYRENLTMLELPAYFSGGFASGNMSAMDETNFSAEGYLPVESLTPDTGGGIDVMIHEIAHQWWGLGTSPMLDDVSGWSSESLTCYSTYCFMRQYFGEDYANERFVKVWQRGWETYRDAFYIQHPEYLKRLSAGDASNVLGALENIKRYDVMSLKLLNGERALGGTEAYHKKLSELYMTHMLQQMTYQDFLSVTGLGEEAMNLE